VLAKGVPAPARTRAGPVGVRVAVAGHGEEEVVVDLEAELDGEGEEGEGRRLASGSEVKARHIGSVGLGSIAWLGWWELYGWVDWIPQSYRVRA